MMARCPDCGEVYDDTVDDMCPRCDSGNVWWDHFGLFCMFIAVLTLVVFGMWQIWTQYG